MADIEMSDESCGPSPASSQSSLGRSTSEYQAPAGSIQATPFAGPYRSPYIEKVGTAAQSLLQHVNCSYLSTKGRAPTLLDLKQHAHSLAVLIKNLSVSDSQGIVNGQDFHQDFIDSTAFDHLNDLTQPYTNEWPPHNKPLTSLLNTRSTTPPPHNQAQEICPLYNVPNPVPTAPCLPYATRQALISHANAALELLDHEYNGMGGILSILPSPADTANCELAQKSLLGQMLLYIQRLVARLHDLEIQYANSLDVLASEAVVPSQTLSRFGPDGRGGRELVYPQDRFVLANCGEDVWQFLNREFEKQELKDEAIRENWVSAGVEGEKVWEKRGGKAYKRAMTVVDLKTRYFRLRGKEGRELKTVFVVPAWQEHPGVRETRRMESTPTVVVVPDAKVPERTSIWEMRRREEMEELGKLRVGYDQATERIKGLVGENKRVNDLLRAKNQDIEAKDEEMEKKDKKLAAVKDLLEKNPADAKAELIAQAGRVAAAKEELALQREEVKKHWKAVEQKMQEADKMREQRIEESLEQERQLRMERMKLNEKSSTLWEEIEKAKVKANAERQEMNERLKQHWIQQLFETEVLRIFLDSEDVQARIGDLEIPDNVEGKAKEQAGEMVEDVMTGSQGRTRKTSGRSRK